MATRTVWLVGSGEYSDYSIAALFATKEAGERYVEIHDPDGGWYSGPDEYTLFDDCPDPRPHLEVTTVIGRGGTGDLRGGRDQEIERIQVPGIDVTDDFKVDVTVALHPSNKAMDSVWVKVSGFDFERVRKVSTERKAHVVADFDLLIEREKARRLAQDVPR